MKFDTINNITGELNVMIDFKISSVLFITMWTFCLSYKSNVHDIAYVYIVSDTGYAWQVPHLIHACARI